MLAFLFRYFLDYFHALYENLKPCAGNASLEAAANWVVEHENDPDIDEMPLVRNIGLVCSVM